MEVWLLVLITCGALTFAIIGVVCALGWLCIAQDRLIYRGRRNYKEKPDKCGIPYEDVDIVTSDDVHLHAWLVTQSKNSSSAPTLLLFIGVGGNIGNYIFLFETYYKLGFNMLLVSYRGYGESGGVSTEKGLRMDAKAALLHAVSRGDLIDVGSIFLFGISLGGAVVLSLAADEEAAPLVQGVIVESTFTSMNDALGEFMRALRFPQELRNFKAAQSQSVELSSSYLSHQDSNINSIRSR